MNKIFSLLFSFRFTLILLAIYGLTMSMATFYEKGTSTAEAFKLFYHSWWFFCVQFLLCVNFIGLGVKLKLIKNKKWGVLLSHYGFVVILVGAMVTHIFSYEGIMHIREGESSSSIYVGNPNNGTLLEVPFTVELKDFILVRYPGSSSPSSYESDVKIKYDGKVTEQKIYMNNIAYVGPFRIYQTSYDKDEKGTVLTVNKDLEGAIISYFGYIIMTLGFILILFHKNSRFRTLARRLNELSSAKSLLISGLLTTSVFSVSAQPKMSVDALKRVVVSDEVADSMSSVLVQNPNGRVEPFNSYAQKMLRKLHRSSSYGDIRAEKVFLGMMSNPYMWAGAQLIYIGANREVRKIVGTDGDYTTFNSVFNTETGEYKLESFLEKIYNKDPKEQNKFDKDILKLDEKVNIMNAIIKMQLLNLFPLEGSASDTWYSSGDDLSQFNAMDSVMAAKAIPLMLQSANESLESGNWKNSLDMISHIKIFQRAKASEEHLISHKKIDAEILYNKVNIFKVSGLGYIIMGVLTLIIVISQILGSASPLKTYAFKSLFVLISLLFIYHTWGIGLRWYVSGRAPWTSSYETMVYVAWCTLVAGFIFVKRSNVTFAVSAVLGGIILMISQLNFLDPEITPLVPVLKSYWLMFHVAIITASYGFFAMSALLGLISLGITIFDSKKRYLLKIEELNIINEMSIIIGLILLSVGVFIGAVWANESWGRYWGWDPKETWALITMIVYAFVIHARFIKFFRSQYTFAVMSVISIYAVLMTFFGVNYYLSGMHSYGSSEGLNSSLLIGVTVVVLLICIIAGVKHKK